MYLTKCIYSFFITEADIFIKELDASKITFSIKHSNSKSIGKIEVDAKELLEKHLNDDENIHLPIEGTDHGSLDIGLNYIPVKYDNVELHEKIDSKQQDFLRQNKFINLRSEE